MSGKLKEVRERISSVKSTMQITNAMKMVSAAKLRKAQQAITDLRPYADRLNKMMVNILSNLDGDASTAFGKSREVNKAAVVVVTSNRGLCGAFNSNVVKEAIKVLDGELKDLVASKNVTIYNVGKKGFDALKNRYDRSLFNGDYVNLFSDLGYENVATASTDLMNQFIAGDVDKVYVCYGRFKNPAVQYPECAQFLPVPKLEVKSDDKKSGKKADYIFEPSKEELLEQLIPSILQTSFQKYCLDTHASEHGARMTAMDSATENANELLGELKINYNKARQESITNEILEIVGGAAALESGS